MVRCECERRETGFCDQRCARRRWCGAGGSQRGPRRRRCACGNSALRRHRYHGRALTHADRRVCQPRPRAARRHRGRGRGRQHVRCGLVRSRRGGLESLAVAVAEDSPDRDARESEEEGLHALRKLFPRFQRQGERGSVLARRSYAAERRASSFQAHCRGTLKPCRAPEPRRQCHRKRGRQRGQRVGRAEPRFEPRKRIHRRQWFILLRRVQRFVDL
mmetsp:Transcript_82934/g.231301  ORF Transcript_82934/g.231301 Transcript_82934/m.231301 type:complete len:217 (-) Transcript_82934:1004-1654(-)